MTGGYGVQGNIYPLLNWWIFYIHEETARRPNGYSTFYLTRTGSRASLLGARPQSLSLAHFCVNPVQAGMRMEWAPDDPNTQRALFALPQKNGSKFGSTHSLNPIRTESMGSYDGNHFCNMCSTKYRAALKGSSQVV